MFQRSAWSNNLVKEEESCNVAPSKSWTDSLDNYLVANTLGWLKQFIAWRYLLFLIMWCFCIVLSFVFISSTFNEYRQSGPITTTTFADYPEKPDPVIVKVCNSVFLDTKKILAYNGTEFGYDAYEFLYEAASGNFMFDDGKWVMSTSVNDMFFLSNRMLDEFRLDVEDFVGTCYVAGIYEDCIKDFEWHLDIETSCYQAKIDLGGYGKGRALKLGFFFNPEIQLGKYIAQKGAYVAIFHPDDYIPYSNGFFVEPKDFIIISATTEHKVQKQSFEKAKCRMVEGPLSYNYTGEPFEVAYNKEYCAILCSAEAYYTECNCSPFYGMNQTNTECLESEENRLCLKGLGVSPDRVEKASQKCMAGCLNKCKQTSLRTKIYRERNKYTTYKFLTLTQDLGSQYSYQSRISQYVGYRLMTAGENLLQEADELKDGLAHVTFYLQSNAQEVVVEVVPFMTFATFVSNVGGLMGLWLGLSAISIIEFLQKSSNYIILMRNTLSRPVNKRRNGTNQNGMNNNYKQGFNSSPKAMFR